jgi:RNA-directed DNA polymerase
MIMMAKAGEPKHTWNSRHGNLHSEKTRLIHFGRFAAEDRRRDGAGRPETFDLLGFTHIRGTIWKSGKFAVQRKTVGKRMTGKLKKISAELVITAT